MINSFDYCLTYTIKTKSRCKQRFFSHANFLCMSNAYLPIQYYLCSFTISDKLRQPKTYRKLPVVFINQKVQKPLIRGARLYIYFQIGRYIFSCYRDSLHADAYWKKYYNDLISFSFFIIEYYPQKKFHIDTKQKKHAT